MPPHDQIALVLQGGGALGAFQAGVYEELSSTPHQPNWIAGVSIGAINAALIAGNEPKKRLERLHQFWDLVSSNVAHPAPTWDEARSAYNQWSAWVHAVLGVPGFYKPRMPPASLQPKGSMGALSIYDTSELRSTIEKLIDFDLINSKRVRLSVGAVNVRTGNSQYFDNFERKIGPEHVMASGALPPAFAPMEIDGEFYWDGGIVSNTPLQYVLDARADTSLLVLQVDLFSAQGDMPEDIPSVMARYKDIMYSSRTRYNTDMAAKIQNTRQAVRELLKKLPAKMKATEEIKSLTQLLSSAPADIVHLIYREKGYELESKDYEFSRSSVHEHWQAGQRDMRDTLNHPEWLKRYGLDDGVTTYDLTRPSEKA